jgi:predicted DNA-binding transcriptional regulator
MGLSLLVIGVLGILVYGWLVFFYNPVFVLQLTAFIAVVAVFTILIWIGYTMATTPPPPDMIEVPEVSEAEAQESADSEPSAVKPDEA